MADRDLGPMILEIERDEIERDEIERDEIERDEIERDEIERPLLDRAVAAARSLRAPEPARGVGACARSRARSSARTAAPANLDHEQAGSPILSATVELSPGRAVSGSVLSVIVMENAQVAAPDGTWFLFVDWQGATRIAFPGDKVKTDCNLDRPMEDAPLVLRPDGRVWSTASLDLDPVAMKKIKRPLAHHCPDPLGGDAIVAACHADDATIRGEKVKIEMEGEPVRLGATSDRSTEPMESFYGIHADGSVVLIGRTSEQGTRATFLVRGARGKASRAWCRPLHVVPHAAPVAFRGAGSVVLAARDIVGDIAHLAEIRDDGTVAREQRCPAVAGPWLHDGQIWWQPEPGSICAGAELGQPERSFPIRHPDAGPGRLLRMPGRKLFLPWHGASVLDLAPAKGKPATISRRHKPGDEVVYRGAEEMMRPAREFLARRGAQMCWIGCTRTSKRMEPRFKIHGRSEPIAYLTGCMLQQGFRWKFKSKGVTSTSFSGADHFGELSRPEVPTSAEDIRALVALHDELELPRATGLASLYSLYEVAARQGDRLPLTAEAEAVVLDALVSGLTAGRAARPGAIAPATAAGFGKAARDLADAHDATSRSDWIPDAAKLVAVTGHRRFGAAAVEPVMKLLASQGDADEVTRMLSHLGPARALGPA
jgi:hypothetical protein